MRILQFYSWLIIAQSGLSEWFDWSEWSRWSVLMICIQRVYGRPHICHFFPQMYFLGSIFLHMKARKLWQNLSKCLKISPNFPKISQNFSTWQFFFTNMICDLCDKYELWYMVYMVLTIRLLRKIDMSCLWLTNIQKVESKAVFCLSRIRKNDMGGTDMRLIWYSHWKMNCSIHWLQYYHVNPILNWCICLVTFHLWELLSLIETYVGTHIINSFHFKYGLHN